MRKLIILLTLLNQYAMNAQILPQQVNLEQLGVRFEIPDGWTGKLEEEYIFLGHETIPGIMVLFENDSETTAHLKKIAMEGIVEEEVQLKVSEDFKVIDEQRIEGMYEGNYNGTPAKGFAIGLVNNLGSGMSILVLTETKKFTKQHRQEANKLDRSVVFFKAKSKGDEMIAYWKKRIVGYKLKYLTSSSSSDYGGGYTGYSQTEIINLYTNGRFDYYSNSHSTVSTGTNAGGFINNKEDNEGGYEITYANNATFLKLNFDNNTAKTYKLTTDKKEQKTLLSGYRFYVVQI